MLNPVIHGELRGSVLYTLEMIVRTATPLDASALRLFFFLSFWLIHIVLCLCRKHLLDPTIDYKVGSGRLFSSREVGWKFSMLHTGFQVSIMVNLKPFFPPLIFICSKVNLKCSLCTQWLDYTYSSIMRMFVWYFQWSIN